MINLPVLFTANSELTVLTVNFFVNSDLFTVNSERSEKSQGDFSLHSEGFFTSFRMTRKEAE